MLGVRRWRETFFDRPKPTVSCSANGKRRRVFRTDRVTCYTTPL